MSVWHNSYTLLCVSSPLNRILPGSDFILASCYKGVSNEDEKVEEGGGRNEKRKGGEGMGGGGERGSN